MNRYPGAEWVPWATSDFRPAYYNDINKPEAAVLHVAEGWASTIRQWAKDGYARASWHYTVCKDGKVMQHLDHNDGGYHAGIEEIRYDGTPNPKPTWKLWKGWGVNVNTYTIGIEHEGFSGQPFTKEQEHASRELCRWLSKELNIPLDRDHFTYHGTIALIDRANDFNTPALRDKFYEFLLEPEKKPEPKPDPSAILKVRLEPVSEPTFHWTDLPDIREMRVRVRLVQDK